MSTARFAILCTFIVVLLFSLSALVAGVIVLAILAGLLALLRDHRRLYFEHSRKSLFTYLAYPFVVVVMIWTTVCATPRIEGMIPWRWQLPDPFPAAYWLYFALGSLFLLWALKPSNPNAHPMTFTGSVFWEQASLLKQTPGLILASLKRAATAIAHEHWLKGLAGVVLLVLSIPVGIVALTAGILAAYWFAVLWAGMSALLVIPLWLVFKVIHRHGIHKRCQGCGLEHAISGPGPMGFLQVQCRCGQKVGIWRSGDEVIPLREAAPSLPWSRRPNQAGTIPLLIIGAVVALLMASRAFGLWDGFPRRLPWSRDSRLEDVASSASKPPVPVRPAATAHPKR